MEQIEFHSMGSAMMAALDADGPEAQQALSKVPTWFETWEQHLSRFRSDSELNEINSRSGEWVTASPVMWDMLLTAQRAERLSGGLVTPALQGALDSYGYDRSFEIVARLNTKHQLVDVHHAPLAGMKLGLDYEKRRVFLPEGTLLDFGGIAKGWAADTALGRLIQNGAGLVDAGGDIATCKPDRDDTAWPLGITDPLSPESTIGLLALRGQAVATSGRDVHQWEQGGIWRHHIIDPRTGEPAISRVLTATVIAPTAIDAEVGAKCALILGEVEGLIWLDSHPGFAGVLALEDGSVVQSSTFQIYVWK